MIKQLIFSILLIISLTAKAQIGSQLTSTIPISETKHNLTPGFGIEFGIFSSRQEDIWSTFYTFGYRIYGSKNIYSKDLSGQNILTSFYRFDNYKEYFIGTYTDYRLLDKGFSPIFGLGVNLIFNSYTNTHYVNNVVDWSEEASDFGFLLMPRLGVIYDLSYYFTINAGVAYILKINTPREPLDNFVSPFIGISFFIN